MLEPLYIPEAKFQIYSGTRKQTLKRSFTSFATMASKPGLLTEWPWKPLGSFKVLF